MSQMKNDYTFVRHGQTYWNKNGIMHGQYDIPLNYTGIKQAKSIAVQLANEHYDICFSSPLSRAISTANTILQYHRNVKIETDDRLKELYKGKLEGKHLNSERLLRNEDKRILSKYDIESKQEFYDRVNNFVDYLENRYKRKKILIVAHSGTIKMLLFAFNKPKEALHTAYYRMRIKNCQAYKPLSLSYGEQKMKIGFFPMVADILHSGHVLALEQAKKHCDLLIVGLHCSPSYKKPQQSIYERYMQLRAVKWVDEVIPYENADRDKDMFASLDYDVYFLGDDHKNHDWEMRETIETADKEIIYLNRRHSYSSSRIKNANKQ